MSKLQRAVAAPMGPLSRAALLRSVAAKQPSLIHTRGAARESDAADIALRYMNFIWYLMLASTLVLPFLIVLSSHFYDAVPKSPNLGAFIIAGGVILIGVAFPLASRYRKLSIAAMKEYAQSRKLDAQTVKKLTFLMIMGASCAELPAFAGLAYFILTRETIGGLLLCSPAVLMMLVLYRPGDLRSV